MNREQWFREYIGLPTPDGENTPRRVTDFDLLKYATTRPEDREIRTAMLAQIAAEEIAKNNGRRYDIAGFIGRMQPPHDGHFFCIELASQISDLVIIGLGSAEKYGTSENPFTVQTRERLLIKGLSRIPDALDRIKIVHLRDYTSDKVWCKRTMAMDKMHGIQIIVGNNGLVNRLLEEDWNVPAVQPLYDRKRWTGTLIRTELVEKKGFILNETPENPIRQMYPIIF